MRHFSLLVEIEPNTMFLAVFTLPNLFWIAILKETDILTMRSVVDTIEEQFPVALFTVSDHDTIHSTVQSRVGILKVQVWPVPLDLSLVLQLGISDYQQVV